MNSQYVEGQFYNLSNCAFAGEVGDGDGGDNNGDGCTCSSLESMVLEAISSNTSITDLM